MTYIDYMNKSWRVASVHSIPEGNDAATSMSESCGGGGSSAPDSIWGKKDDEDDLKFARRCLNMAHSMRKTKSVKRVYYR